MHSSRLKWLLMPLAAIVFITGLVVAVQTRRVDNGVLKNAGKGTEWLTYGHTYSEQRYSPLKLIDTTNVSRLGLAWSFEVGPGDVMMFPAPSPGHNLRNPYDADLVYLMGGERHAVEVAEFPRAGKRAVIDRNGFHFVDAADLKPFTSRDE